MDHLPTLLLRFAHANIYLGKYGYSKASDAKLQAFAEALIEGRQVSAEDFAQMRTLVERARDAYIRGAKNDDSELEEFLYEATGEEGADPYGLFDAALALIPDLPVTPTASAPTVEAHSVGASQDPWAHLSDETEGPSDLLDLPDTPIVTFDDLLTHVRAHLENIRQHVDHDWEWTSPAGNGTNAGEALEGAEAIAELIEEFAVAQNR